MNKRRKKQNFQPPIVLNVKDSIFHSGKGNANQEKVVQDKPTDRKSILFSKYWWRFFIPIAVGLIIFFITQAEFSVPPDDIQVEFPIASNNLSELASLGNNNKATTTLSISDLLSKAISMETTVEQQDFLTKYIGGQIYGSGVVKQISRWGNDKFVVDIKVDRATVSCMQDSGEENEKRLLLLKGKIVDFSGVFTYQNIFGHGLEIEECQIL